MSKRISILIYGELESGRDALTEEKYRDLAIEFMRQGFEVHSRLYNDDIADEVKALLLEEDGVLVWINPIEQGHDRTRLDAMLAEVSRQGRFVSTLPEVILKMGTKDILYKTKDMDWSADIRMYQHVEDFRNQFPVFLKKSGIRVLKQYRGNGGNGVFKIGYDINRDQVQVTHALSGAQEQRMSWAEFFQQFDSYFENEGLLIDQEWNTHMTNGMVRCYLSGSKVAGFGYQEINALYELNLNGHTVSIPPSKRYYFTEQCGLFQNLRMAMETKWVPELKNRLSIPDSDMPVIWDADFFINHLEGDAVPKQYSLCEINVSCVSPFPPSAIPHMVARVRDLIT